MITKQCLICGKEFGCYYYKCKINNSDCSKKIIAHHILMWRDYPDLRFDVNNGITLCRFHHPRRREEEKRLILFFQGLVSVSKDNFDKPRINK